MRRSMVKLPNRLILDTSLSLSARRVGAVLYSRRNALGLCRKSLEQLGGLSGCSIATVRKAVLELDAAGYITRRKTYRFHTGKGMLVYGRTAYLCSLDFSGGFTMVPRNLFSLSMSASSFSICLYLCLSAGNQSRCFPSLSRITSAVGVARSTVCRALKQLKQLPILLVQLCRKANRAFANSSYFFSKPAAISAPDVTRSAPVSHPGPLFRLRGFLGGLLSALRRVFSPKGVVSFLANYV